MTDKEIKPDETMPDESPKGSKRKGRAFSPIEELAISEELAIDELLGDRIIDMERTVMKYVDQRKAAGDALTDLRQAFINAEIAAGYAQYTFNDLLSRATTGLDPTRNTADEIETAYKLAQDKHAETIEKARQLDEIRSALYKAQIKYLDLYHAVLVDERRAVEASSE